MRKFAAFIILFAAWYFAGMHGQSSVMSAVICSAVIIIISYIFPFFMKRKIDAFIPPQTNAVYKNTENFLNLSAKNRSRLPLSRFALTLEMKYKTNKRGTKKRLIGSAAGSSEGDTEAQFYYSAPYCGLVEINLKKISIYDYFGLFSSSKKLIDRKSEIYVFPQPKKVNFIMTSYGAYTNQEVTESSSDKSGEDHSEIRFIREYRNGDLIRHIHRNFSARTEKLWIKQYSKENDYIFDLVLDTSETALTTELLDAIYEIVFSITHSIIQYDAVICLYWYDRISGGMRSRVISDSQSLQEAITLVYKSDMNCTKQEYSSAKGRLSDDGMLINANLDWFFLGRHIYSFQKENVENELLTNVFDLRG